MVSPRSRGLVREQLRRWERAGAGVRLQQQAQHGGKRRQLQRRDLPGRGIQLWQQLKREVCIKKHHQEELSELKRSGPQLGRSRRGRAPPPAASTKRIKATQRATLIAFPIGENIFPALLIALAETPLQVQLVPLHRASPS